MIKRLILILVLCIMAFLIACTSTIVEPEICYINPPELCDSHYHKGDGQCRGYSINYSIQTTIDQAEADGYTPCPRCYSE